MLIDWRVCCLGFCGGVGVHGAFSFSLACAAVRCVSCWIDRADQHPEAPRRKRVQQQCACVLGDGMHGRRSEPMSHHTQTAKLPAVGPDAIHRFDRRIRSTRAKQRAVGRFRRLAAWLWARATTGVIDQPIDLDRCAGPLLLGIMVVEETKPKPRALDAASAQIRRAYGHAPYGCWRGLASIDRMGRHPASIRSTIP